MKILMLTTIFYPDTAIAAVRPSMFAHYLSQMGHDITVIRSGEINKFADKALTYADDNIRVLSYFGENSPAERFARGEEAVKPESVSRISSLPYAIRKPIAAAYHRVMRPLVWKKISADAEQRNALQREVINSLREERFDIVWATVGGFENVMAARYAAQVFHCPWIADFRDPMAQQREQSILWYRAMKRFEQDTVRDADATVTVSHALKNKLSGRGGGRCVYTVHNGYGDPEAEAADADCGGKKLVFCYTGQFYLGRHDCSPLFEVISELQKSGRISLENVVFEYAGPNMEELARQAEKCGVEAILHDNGYLDKRATVKLQSESDIFTVFSWNTKRDQGLLSGKLYEGIRSRKPILSIVSGNVPHSELCLLNEQYHYGFCYEKSSGGEARAALSAWVTDAYRCKMDGKAVSYEPEPALFTDFRYDNLTKKLEELMTKIVSGRPDES